MSDMDIVEVDDESQFHDDSNENRKLSTLPGIDLLKL